MFVTIRNFFVREKVFGKVDVLFIFRSYGDDRISRMFNVKTNYFVMSNDNENNELIILVLVHTKIGSTTFNYSEAC